MFSRNRLHNAALRGCVTVTLCLSPFHAHSQEQQEPKAPAEQNYTSGKRIVVPDATTLRSIFEEAIKVYRDDKTAGEEGEQRKEEREKTDLIAQQDMARWALIMWLIAAIQLPLSVVTLGFLYKTFRENKRTADAAVKAAEAAIGAERAWLLLVIVEENFANVMRAYTEPDTMAWVIRKHSELDDLSERPKIEFYFENFGKTPAFVKALSARLEFWSNTPDTSIFTPEMPLPRDSIVAASTQWPAEEIEFDGEDSGPKPRFIRTLQIPFDEVAGKALKAGHAKLWFHGQVRYDDVWGNEHRTQFCWAYDGGTGWFIQHNGKPYNENT